ncbi:MAG: hypothetical protein KAI64_05460 [Thermoplasmata archaeon]|nr:hypothetical protein [Thermoplasmata archaeon]
MEFFKDDRARRCPHCHLLFPNPKLDLGCAEWCSYAKYCFGGQGVFPQKKREKKEKPPKAPKSK